MSAVQAFLQHLQVERRMSAHTLDAYRRDLDALEETIEATGARLLLLCNPHNPVGRVWSREELAALEEVTARHGVVVVADEIHADLALPGFATTPLASLGEAAY